MKRLALWSGLLLAGCGEATGDPAFLSFTVDPASGLPGDTVTFEVEVEHFLFTVEHTETTAATTGATGDGVATDHTEGETETHGHDDEGVTQGHVHVYFDDLETNPVAMMEEEVADGVVPEDATPGMHTFIARLHGSDHLIIEPQVTAEVDFEVLE